MGPPRILAIWIALFTAQLASAQPLPEIFQPDPKFPDSFVDLDLKIQSMNCPTWDNCTVTAKGLHRGVEVGLQIQIERKGARRLGIQYRSIGEVSDRLLEAMTQLYKVPTKNKRFRKSAYADLIVLQIKDDVMANKVFFEVDRPGYAELYTNIDKRKGVLEIHEKDEDYRVNVLKALSE
jgi:hypothetical protein